MRVGLERDGLTGGSGGTLAIHPGRLELTLTRATSLVHVHAPFTVTTDLTPEVTLVHARLGPPWCNTALLVPGSSDAAVIPGWKRAALREALAAAGFRITELQTRFRLSLSN